MRSVSDVAVPEDDAPYAESLAQRISREESRRDSGLQPRVASSELPWVIFACARQLQRSCAITASNTMPQSLSAVYIHLVFSTKERRPFLRDKVIRESLHAYAGAVSKQLGCPPLKVGGVEDHVHLLCRLARTITQAEWVKEIKRVSSLWLKEQSRDYLDFQWQGGYADFSVSQSNLAEVSQYIAEQEQHHKKMSFQDELRALLRKHNIEWDEGYVWD